ncbi:MAG: hypothetical protein HGA79_08645 [Anaerolineales bacterium]|nr:hypothetical protein [Anaerolineales bacterium]
MTSHYELPDSRLPENIPDPHQGIGAATDFTDEALNLEILAEEAAEVIRIKSKCIRFGMDNFHPKNEHGNREALAREIGHFLRIVEILVKNGTIDLAEIKAGEIEKSERLSKWYGIKARVGKVA